jgi:hypothetical protein
VFSQREYVTETRCKRTGGKEKKNMKGVASEVDLQLHANKFSEQSLSLI